MDQEYDILIIGSGLGGLITGNILAKKGYKIGIIEKNPVAGGCLVSFKHDGVMFDTGIHYIGGLGEGQVINKLCKYLGILKDFNYRSLDHKGFDQYIIGGREYIYASGYEKFRSQLISSFPSEEKAIDKYILTIQEIAQSVPLYNLQLSELDLETLYKKFNYGNAWEFICSITENGDLRQLLSGPNILYAGLPETSFLYMHALITNHYIEGAYRFVDGTNQITNSLMNKLKMLGGEVICNQQAVQFNFNGTNIRSVKTKSDREFFAENFISDIHPFYTIQMIEEGKLRDTYRKRILSLENTISTFTLYVSLEDGKVPYMNSNLYYYPNGSVWAAANFDANKFPQGFNLFPIADSIDEKFTRGFSVLAFMDYSQVAKWENTAVENRGNDYLEFKELCSQKLLALVENALPGIRKYIKSYISATPLTLRDYTGTYRGATYGIQHDCRKPLESLIFAKTKIPNLYFTGQNLNLHGFMGVSVGSLLTCAEFTDLDQLIREINHA